MALNRMIRYVSLILLLLLLPPLSYCDTSSGSIKSVAVSPDAKLIVVDVRKGSTSFIYRIAVDTGIATRLTNAKAGEEDSPTFSPDGKRVAYTYWPGDGARPRIVIVNADGSNLRQWSPSGVADLSPVFSPDNKTLVFSRSEFYGSASPMAQPHPHGWEFYASDLDGTNVREVTRERFYLVSPASVSPDGKSIVVVTETLETGQHIAIYSLMDPGPPTRTLQPHVPHEVDHKNPNLSYPNYLPDGNILFMAGSEGWRGIYSYEVYRLDAQTGAVEKITTGNGYSTGLRVSSDGKTAAFLKWRKNRLGEPVDSEVYLLDVQTHAVTPLKISGLN
jgi:Tol biopolymer transport system component